MATGAVSRIMNQKELEQLAGESGGAGSFVRIDIMPRLWCALLPHDEPPLTSYIGDLKQGPYVITRLGYAYAHGDIIRKGLHVAIDAEILRQAHETFLPIKDRHPALQAITNAFYSRDCPTAYSIIGGERITLIPHYYFGMWRLSHDDRWLDKIRVLADAEHLGPYEISGPVRHDKT